MSDRKRKFPDEVYDQIAEAAEAGEKLTDIAKRLGVHPSTVTWTCLRLGADIPEGRRQHATSPRRTAMRSGHAVRPFLPEEDTLLLELKADKKRNSEIARHLGRAPVSIYARLLTLGRHDARAEEAQ